MKAVTIEAASRQWSGFVSDLATQMSLCEASLVELQRLAERGNFDNPFGQLLARACDMLDDIDEILLALNPKRDAHDFAIVAKLHRQLEAIQAIVPPRWRSRPQITQRR